MTTVLTGGLRLCRRLDFLEYDLQSIHVIHPRARSSYTAVDRLMSKVLARLEELPKYQEAARLEFGLDDAGSSKERRERIWRDVFFVSEKTFRTRPKYERRLIELVAQTIDDLEPDTAEPVVSVTTTAYVVRPLSELCLVRTEPERLVVSSLTRALLRKLLADRPMKVFYRAIHSMVVKVGEGEYEFLTEVELFLLGWSPADIASLLLSKFVIALRLASMMAGTNAAKAGAGAVGIDDSIRPEMFSDSIWETTYLMVRSLESSEMREFIEQYQDMVPGQTLDEYWETIKLMARGLEDAKQFERKFGALPQPFVDALKRPPPTLPETILWLNEQGIKLKKSQHRLQKWQRIYATFRVAQSFREHVAVPIGADDMLPEGDELLDFCIYLVDGASTANAFVEKARRSQPES